MAEGVLAAAGAGAEEEEAGDGGEDVDDGGRSPAREAGGGGEGGAEGAVLQHGGHDLAHEEVVSREVPNGLKGVWLHGR